MAVLSKAIMNFGLNRTINQIKNSEDPMGEIQRIIEFNEKALSRNNPYEIELARKQLNAVEVYLRTYPKIEGKTQHDVKHTLKTVQAKMRQVNKQATKNTIKGAASGVGSAVGMGMVTPSSLFRAIKVQNPMLGLVSDAIGAQFNNAKQSSSAEDELNNSLKKGKETESKNEQQNDEATKLNKHANDKIERIEVHLLEQRDLLEGQTTILERLLAYTMDVWGDSANTLESILEKNTQSVERLKEIDEEGKRARLERLEREREANNLNEPMGPPRPELSTPEEDERGGLLEGGVLGMLGLKEIFDMFTGGSRGGNGPKGVKAFAKNLVTGIFGFMKNTVKVVLRTAAKTVKVGLAGLALSTVFAVFDAFNDDEVKRVTGSDALTLTDRLRTFSASIFGGFGDALDWILGFFTGREFNMGDKIREKTIENLKQASAWLTDQMFSFMHGDGMGEGGLVNNFDDAKNTIVGYYDGLVGKVTDFFEWIHNLFTIDPKALWDKGIDIAKDKLGFNKEGDNNVINNETLKSDPSQSNADDLPTFFGTPTRNTEIKNSTNSNTSNTVIDARNNTVNNSNTTIVTPTKRSVRDGERSSQMYFNNNYSPLFG